MHAQGPDCRRAAARGLRVWADRKREYEELIARIRQHATTEFIYAAPDVPEVYFLAERRNPTRTIFDIFDEPAGRTARIFASIDTHDVRVAVVSTKPEFSPPLDPELARRLTARFPQWEQIGRYRLGWR